MSPFKKLAGQTAIYGIPSVIGRILNYLLTPLYTYKFTTGEFGVVTEMYSYVAFLLIFLLLGMETTFFRFMSKEDDGKKVFTTSMFPVTLLTTAFTFLALLFSQNIAEIIQYPDQSEYVIIFALIIAFDALSALPLAKLRDLGKAKRFALINIVSIFINIFLNVFFIYYCLGLYEAGDRSSWLLQVYSPEIGIGYIFIANLVASLIKFLLLVPDMKQLSFNIDFDLLKKMLAYAFPLLIAGIALKVNETLDRVLLKYMLSSAKGLAYALTQVGIYGACYKISVSIAIFIQAYRYAAEPFFFAREKDSEARNIYATLTEYFVISCSFIFLIIMLFIDEVMFFVGEEFREGKSVVSILLLANILFGIYYNLSVWFKLSNRTAYGAYITVVGALITILVNVIFIPLYGYMASAWATLLCYAAMTLLCYFIGQKFYPIPYRVLKILTYFFVPILLVEFSMWVIDNGWVSRYLLNTLIISAFASVVYLSEKKKKALT